MQYLRKPHPRKSLVRSVLGPLLALWLLAPMAASAASPQISAVDVPGTKPLLAAVVDLAQRHYVEQEFFVSGIANRYKMANPLANAEVVDGNWPWTTRVLVRRPTDAARFNGTVVLEWLNVTVGQDVDFVWHALASQMMDDGAVYVGVSAQRVGVDHLKKWNAKRYGTLSLSTTDAATDRTLEPTNFPVAGGDTLAWDVLTQVAQAIRTGGADNILLPKFNVKWVVASGESQSAGLLTRYYNSIHPMQRVMDGFLFYDGANALRDDLGTPALSVESEWRHWRAPVQMALPDTNTLRRWPMAGASHVSFGEIEGIDKMILRDASVIAPDGKPISLTTLIANTGCKYGPLWSTIPNDVVLRAGFAALSTWIKTGTPAPSAPRFGLDGEKLARDGQGKIQGGIRLPQFEVPHAENLAVNEGQVFCTLAGHHRVYDPDEMTKLYGAGERYRELVTDSLLRNVASGYILPVDAKAILNTLKR